MRIVNAPSGSPSSRFYRAIVMTRPFDLSLQDISPEGYIPYVPSTTDTATSGTEEVPYRPQRSDERLIPLG